MDCKVGDKVVALVNGFSAEVRVCEVESVDNGFGFVRYGEGRTVYVAFADCEPAPAGAQVGDEATLAGGNAAAARRAFRRPY
jgi:hypothetical protein